MKRGNLIIIPDENQILNPIFKEDITGKDAHNTGIEKFIKKYYPNTQIKIDLDDYNGAPCEIVKMNHLVIKTEDTISLLIFYLPEIITDRQITWLMEQQFILGRYQTCVGLSETKEENKIIFKEMNGLSDIMKEAKRKNSRKDEVNVR